MVWDVSPILFELGSLQVRWYGALFASAFLIGSEIMRWIYKKEGRSEADMTSLFYSVFFGTLIGARLGHTLFYEPEIYLANPIEIFKVWEGGLASHGAFLGIMAALAFHVRRKGWREYLWVCDRVCILVALSGALIRLGNFFNSEIIGKPTDIPWAVVFSRIDSHPRHPSQLYESMFCVVLFILLILVYKKMQKNTPKGLLLGLFLTFCFSFRILVEFTKENQVAFENTLPLNMGQLLSIPIVLLGLFLIKKSSKRELD